ncbi:MAG: hypothetical protein AAGF11_30460 [Myxococcota bacterium]
MLGMMTVSSNVHASEKTSANPELRLTEDLRNARSGRVEAAWDDVEFGTLSTSLMNADSSVAQ